MASVVLNSGGRSYHHHHQQDGIHHDHNHARLQDDEYAMARLVDIEGPNGGSDGLDITATQKMISAMSGSLLTSVLGT